MTENDPVDPARLIAMFASARSDPNLVVLEGFHALKHALRFDAEIVVMAAADPETVARLAAQLAPDVGTRLATALTVSADVAARLSPEPPATGIVGIARRPEVDAAEILSRDEPEPVVFLDRPRHLGNLGAAIRVAAAAAAGALLSSGDRDPWDPAALRGSAGLHFAIPVAAVAHLPMCGRAVVALDPEGRPLDSAEIPPGAVLAFGSERAGLNAGLLRRADMRLSIPMRAGVSSLNLATAVAIALYAGRFASHR